MTKAERWTSGLWALLNFSLCAYFVLVFDAVEVTAFIAGILFLNGFIYLGDAVLGVRYERSREVI